MKTDVMTEKSRIDSLLQQGRISKEEHQALIDALEKKEAFPKTLFKRVVNPFDQQTIATNLIVGGLAVIAMSAIGGALGLHFRGILDFQIIQEGKPTYSAIELLGQNAVDVLAVTVFFYLGSLLCRCKNLRPIDFLGTVVFSRLPYAIFALFLGGLGPFFPSLLPRRVIDASATIGIIVMSVAAIAFLVWQMTLLFSALKESSGMRGRKLWLTFIVGLLLAEVASYLLNHFLFS